MSLSKLPDSPRVRGVIGTWWRFFLRLGRWALFSLVILEIGSFLFIKTTNLLTFGHFWKGSPVHYDPYALFLNVKGVRPTANSATAKPGEKLKHIWMLGGSTTRGDTVPDHQTLPSYLALTLNGPGTRWRVAVVNYGENTFNSLMEAKYLQKLLIETPRPPDLVIFYDGANDCMYFNEYHTIYGHYGYRRLKGVIESYRRSAIGLFKPLTAALYCSYTLEAYDRLRHAVVTGAHPSDPDLLEMGAAMQERYEHVRRLAASYGATFLLFWQPMLWVESGVVDPGVTGREKQFGIMQASFLKARQSFQITNQSLAQCLQDKPYFVDLRNVLCSRREPVYDPDGVHLDAYGNRLVAEAMAREIVKRGW